LTSFKNKKPFKKIIEWGLKFLIKLCLILIIFTIVQVSLLRFIDPPFTVRILLIRFKNTFSSKYYIRPHYYWQPLNKISPHLKKAVLASEDQRFLSHKGFDIIEMNKAVQDILRAKRLRGASTITMQAARSVFLWPGRSWLRKTVEAYYTVLIEIFWSKMRILEIYLNTVDWGTGIIGAEAASRKYFNISAEQINPSQAARMAAILPSPHKWSPTNPSDYVKKRQKIIMQYMKKMPQL